MKDKSKLTIVTEVSGIIGLIATIIFGINAWVSSDEKKGSMSNIVGNDY